MRQVLDLCLHHLAKELLPLLTCESVAVPGGPQLEDGSHLLVTKPFSL